MSYVPFAFLYICIIMCMSILAVTSNCFQSYFHFKFPYAWNFHMFFFSCIWFIFLINHKIVYLHNFPPLNLYLNADQRKTTLTKKKIKKIEEIIFVQSVGTRFLVNLRTSKHKDKNWPPRYNRNIVESGINSPHPTHTQRIHNEEVILKLHTHVYKPHTHFKLFELCSLLKTLLWLNVNQQYKCWVPVL